MNVKELKNNVVKIFPYLPSIMCNHITEDGTIEHVHPIWYDAIFRNASDNICETVLLRKYRDLILDDVDNYSDEYEDFLQYINESMYRYFDLFTQVNNPYHNVDEHTIITDTFGEVENEKLFGKRKSTSSIGERVNEVSYAQDTVTTTDGRYGQDSNVLKATNNSNTTTSAKTDTQTNNKNGSTDILENDSYIDKDTTMTYTNTHETIRGGNIGVTTNKTLAFEHLEYANMMKLYDMFIDEWVDYFSIGLWGD